tara:strand:+ start:50 stop:307 length:258 start_codon:yes stop_codon:yes gene_type:complete
MSSELHKYIETSIKEREELLKAEVINFPNESNSHEFKNENIDNYGFWKLYDKSYSKEDGDQLKTVVGICFMFSVLFLLGLYSNLV